MFTRIHYLLRAITIQKNWWVQITDALFAVSKQPVYMQLRNGLTITGRRGTTDRATINSVWLEDMYNIPNLDWSTINTCIDIGGHIGSATLFFASKNKNMQIFTYEPAPANFAQLQTNVTKNNLGNRIHITPAAVDADEGTKILHLMSTTGGNSFFEYEQSAQTITVPTTTLSNILASNAITICDLLKIDCEGAEYNILYATPPEDLAKIRTIILEHHAFSTEPKQNVEDLQTFLEAHNFIVTRPYKYILLARKAF